MAHPAIDLRRLKAALKGRVEPERELPAPAEKEMLETEAAAHPEEASLGTELLHWESVEAETGPESAILLLFLGSTLGLGGIATLVFWNVLFGIFLIIAGGLTISYAFRPPRRVSFAVTSRGIQISRRIFGFEDLSSFWIFYDPPLFRELYVVSKKHFMPHIRIPLGDIDPVRIREVLLRFLPEVEQEPSAIDIISKRLGF